MRALLLALVLAPGLAWGQTRVTTKQARTAAPVSVSRSTTSSTEGTSRAFAKADHQHAVATPTPAALPTCAPALEGIPSSPSGTGGTGTGQRTRTCVCLSDGGSTPVYAWVNADTHTVGTASTCPP